MLTAIERLGIFFERVDETGKRKRNKWIFQAWAADTKIKLLYRQWVYAVVFCPDSDTQHIFA